jgi:dephospho-CoA kinase
MLKVGLTGGLACGKTTIAAMFQKRGAHVVLADEIAHHLLDPGTEVYEKVVATFGREILNPDGAISRPKLADIAFQGRIDELNAIVHPAVIRAQEDWMEEVGDRDPHAIAIVEAALMIEAGAHKCFDKLIAVTCNFEQKVQRVALRMGISAEAARVEVERRMKSQLPDDKKAELADFVIDNSGTVAEAEARVDGVWRQLLKAEQASVRWP